MPQNAPLDRRGPQLARPADAPLPIIRFELAEHSGYPMGWVYVLAVDALVAYQVDVGVGVVVLDGDDDNVIQLWDPFVYYGRFRMSSYSSKIGLPGREGFRGSMGLAIWMADAQRYEILSLDRSVWPIEERWFQYGWYYWPDTALPHYLVESAYRPPRISWLGNDFWFNRYVFYDYDEQFKQFHLVGGPALRPGE